MTEPHEQWVNPKQLAEQVAAAEAIGPLIEASSLGAAMREIDPLPKEEVDGLIERTRRHITDQN